MSQAQTGSEATHISAEVHDVCEDIPEKRKTGTSPIETEAEARDEETKEVDIVYESETFATLTLSKE